MQQMRRYDHQRTGNFEAMREIELVPHRCRAAVHAVTHTPRCLAARECARSKSAAYAEYTGGWHGQEAQCTEERGPEQE
jgi:hypothetical protein